MIKYQLPDTWFDQIRGHKDGIYLHGKLSTELLAQVAKKKKKKKNAKLMFTKTGRLLFFLSIFSKVTIQKTLNKYCRRLKK